MTCIKLMDNRTAAAPAPRRTRMFLSSLASDIALLSNQKLSNCPSDTRLPPRCHGATSNGDSSNPPALTCNTNTQYSTADSPAWLNERKKKKNSPRRLPVSHFPPPPPPARPPAHLRSPPPHSPLLGLETKLNTRLFLTSYLSAISFL